MTTNPNLVLGFPNGNAEWYFFAGTQYIPKAMNLLNKSILLIIDAAMIELYGGLNKFIKQDGIIVPTMQKDYTFKTLQCKFTYVVEAIKGYFGDMNAIVYDQNYIKAKFEGIGQISSVVVQIDTNTGLVTVTFSLSAEVL